MIVGRAEERRYPVHVTEADITRGRRYSPIRCPVARAVGRALEQVAQHRPRIGRVSVIEYRLELGPHEIQLPGWLREWIRNFDELGPSAVIPTAFDLIERGNNWRLQLAGAV